MERSGRLALFLTLVTLACPVLQAAGAELPEGARRLESTQLAMTIGADGKAVDIECISENAKRLCAVLSRAVTTWAFEPARKNDAPVAVPVFMDLNLVAVPEQSGFAVRALDADLALRGATEQSIQPVVPPPYPQRAQMRGITGRVELELIIEPGRPNYRIGRIWLDGQEQSSRRHELVAASARAMERHPVRSPPPELLVECVEFMFTLDPGPMPPKRDKACHETHVPGFSGPKLLTDASAARF